MLLISTAALYRQNSIIYYEYQAWFPCIQAQTLPAVRTLKSSSEAPDT